MVGTPYHRGRSREYQVLKLLRKEGWLCSRSAMSHGPIDVFAARDGKGPKAKGKRAGKRMTGEKLQVLLDKAVAAGKITQAQADEKLAAQK